MLIGGGDLNKRLDTYYDFCLSHIPKKSWLIKIDTDHIYSQTALKDVINSAKKTYHSIYLPAINMHFDGKDLYFLKDTLKIGYDHWLIYNQNLSFEYDGVMEILKINRTNYRQKSQHIVSLHFPLMKKSRNATKDNLIPYDDFDIDAFAKKHLLTQEDIDFLKNKQKIISFFNT